MQYSLQNSIILLNPAVPAGLPGLPTLHLNSYGAALPDSGVHDRPRGWLRAPGRVGQGATDRVHLRSTELRDRLREQRLRNRPQVVEADRALDRHAVGRSELDFAVGAADRARDKRDAVTQPRQRLVRG